MNVLSAVNFLNLLTYEWPIRKFPFVSHVHNAYDISTPFLRNSIYFLLLCKNDGIIGKKNPNKQWGALEKIILQESQSQGSLSVLLCYRLDLILL